MAVDHEMLLKWEDLQIGPAGCKGNVLCKSLIPLWLNSIHDGFTKTFNQTKYIHLSYQIWNKWISLR